MLEPCSNAYIIKIFSKKLRQLWLALRQLWLIGLRQLRLALWQLWLIATIVNIATIVITSSLYPDVEWPVYYKVWWCILWICEHLESWCPVKIEHNNSYTHFCVFTCGIRAATGQKYHDYVKFMWIDDETGPSWVQVRMLFCKRGLAESHIIVQSLL